MDQEHQLRELSARTLTAMQADDVEAYGAALAELVDAGLLGSALGGWALTGGLCRTTGYGALVFGPEHERYPDAVWPAWGEQLLDAAVGQDEDVVWEVVQGILDGVGTHQALWTIAWKLAHLACETYRQAGGLAELETVIELHLQVAANRAEAELIGASALITSTIAAGHTDLGELYLANTISRDATALQMIGLWWRLAAKLLTGNHLAAQVDADGMPIALLDRSAVPETLAVSLDAIDALRAGDRERVVALGPRIAAMPFKDHFVVALEMARTIGTRIGQVRAAEHDVSGMTAQARTARAEYRQASERFSRLSGSIGEHGDDLDYAQLAQFEQDNRAAKARWIAAAPDLPTPWWPGGWRIRSAGRAFPISGMPGSVAGVWRTEAEAKAARPEHVAAGDWVVEWSPLGRTDLGGPVPLDDEFWATGGKSS